MKPGFKFGSARFQILFLSPPPFWSGLVLCQSFLRKYACCPPLKGKWLHFHAGWWLSFGSDWHPQYSWVPGSSFWRSMFIPILVPWGGEVLPAALTWIPQASFVGMPGGSSVPPKPPRRPQSELLTLEAPPPPRPSVCSVSTKEKRGIKMHLIKITSQVQGTKSRQII